MATQDLQKYYQEEIAPKLKTELKFNNIMSVPKLKKVTVNVGIGSYVKNQGKDFSHITESITKITGQKPVLTKARKAISNFKVREGDIVGISVTLRGKRMYDFINKLINIVYPRVRDFRGVSPKCFDGNGNMSVGFREHTVFPEIHPDEVSRLHGIQINVETSAKNDDDARALLKAFGFPFKK